MERFIAYYLLLMAFASTGLVLLEYLWGRQHLCTLRNVAILGFIIFELLSGYLALSAGYYEPYSIQNPARTGAIFALWATVFLAVGLFSYRAGFGSRWLAGKAPVSDAVPSDPTMLLMAAVLTAMGLACRVVASTTPVIGAVLEYLGTGYAAMAVGLCGWVLGKRFFNPLVIAYTALIGAAAVATVLFGSFGRRGLVAVGAGILWGMYYSRLRFDRPLVALGRLGAVAVVPLVVVALFSSVRSSAEHQRSTTQQVQAVARGGSLTEGLQLLFEGQNVGPLGLWLIENYPERFEYRWFFTPAYTAAVLIPRAFWEDKPEPLSTKIASQADIPRVNQDKLKLSPGILGSAAAEGGIIAVVVYAVLAGLFLRFYDELCMLYPYSPFVVLPVASAMGQVLGFARGETSVMVNAFILGTAGCLVTMIVVGKVVESFGGKGQRGGEPGEDQESGDEADPYEAWRDYGREPEAASAR